MARAQTKLRILGLLGIITIVGGCGEQPAEQGPPAGPAAAVVVAQVGRGSIATYYTANATLEPDKHTEILARVSGLVMELSAEEGDRVTQADQLLRIEDAEYRHRRVQAEAEAVKQKARFARLEQMFAGDLISAEDFETARSDLLSAEASQALAALEFSYTKVTAPFAGHVITRSVDLGQMVSPGTQLFTLADMSRLLARIHVPAKEFRQIQIEQPVIISLDASPAEIAGRIALVSPVIDPMSGTIKVTVAVTDYPPGTRPGDFAEVRVITDRHEHALLVPKIAVFTDKGEEVAFVTADSTAARRVVVTGYRTDAETEILAGLTEGEFVVIQGQRSLEDGQTVRITAQRSYEASGR